MLQDLQTRLRKMQIRHGQTDVVSYRRAISASLYEDLHLLVKVSSVRQAMWGFASAGPHKAMRYTMAKAEKGRGRH